MYTSPTYKTKKELKEAVASGKQVEVFSPGFFPCPDKNGMVEIEGPECPEPDKWYGMAAIENRIIKSVY